MTPVFLLLEEILVLQKIQLERYGGKAGIREMGLLESAVAMPQSSFAGQFLHADLLEMAAAYLFHLVQNHPFVDGNKRIGADAAVVFLAMNDVEVIAEIEPFKELVLSVARGETPKSAVAEFFRERSRPLRRKK